MREARIIFPSEPLAREAARFEHDLVSAFGGFTRTIGDGGWAGDDGKAVYETVSIYDIAMSDTPSSCTRLRELAIQYGRLLSQDAVYVRFASWEVKIIPLKAESKPAASPAPASHKPVGYPGLNKAEKAFVDRLKDPQGVMRDKTDYWERKTDANRQAGSQALDALRQQPGGNVGTGERQAMPLGVKRLPKTGEVWATGCGGRAAVLGRAAIMDGGYYTTLLSGGNSSMSPGYHYTVDLDGRFLRGGEDHPLDLVRFLTTF